MLAMEQWFCPFLQIVDKHKISAVHDGVSYSREHVFLSLSFPFLNHIIIWYLFLLIARGELLIESNQFILSFVYRQQQMLLIR